MIRRGVCLSGPVLKPYATSSAFQNHGQVLEIGRVLLVILTTERGAKVRPGIWASEEVSKPEPVG